MVDFKKLAEDLKNRKPWVCPKCGLSDSISHEGARKLQIDATRVLQVPHCPTCYDRFVTGMINDLEEVQHELSEWARSFVHSIKDQFSWKHSLSDKRMLKLNELWEDHYARQ